MEEELRFQRMRMEEEEEEEASVPGSILNDSQPLSDRDTKLVMIFLQ